MEEKKMKPITVVEIVLTYISLGWAFVAFMSPDFFERSLNFAQLQSIVREEFILGIIMSVCAFIKIVGMITKNARIRWAGLVLTGIFWIFVSSTFLMAQGVIVPNTGFFVYSALAIIALWTSKEVKRIGTRTK